MAISPSVDITEEGRLPCLLTDADDHSTPRQGAHLEYMDPDKDHLALYLSQLKNRTPLQVCQIMRDNLAGFLGLED